MGFLLLLTTRPKGQMTPFILLCLAAVQTTLAHESDPRRGPVLEDAESVPFVPENEPPLPQSLESMVTAEPWRIVNQNHRKFGQTVTRIEPHLLQILGQDQVRVYTNISIDGMYQHLDTYVLNVSLISCAAEHLDQCWMETCLLEIQDGEDPLLLSKQCSNPRLSCFACANEDQCGLALNSLETCRLPDMFQLDQFPVCYTKIAQVAGQNIVLERGCGTSPFSGQECDEKDTIGYLKICHCVGNLCNGIVPNSESDMTLISLPIRQLRADIKRMLSEL